MVRRRKRLSKDVKEMLVRKVLARDGKRTDDIAQEYGISKASLDQWVRNSERKKSDRIPTRSERFKHLQVIAALSETEVGAYCRQHGLYSAQLKEWEQEFMQDNQQDKDQYKAEILRLKKRNAELERELSRKEKALAETAALLVLKKKADAIWGEKEAD